MQTQQPINEWLQQFTELGKTLRVAFQQIALTTSQMFDIFRPLILAFAESIEKLPEDLRIVISTLAERGWYISAEMDMSFLRELQAAVESGDFVLLDQMMESWVSSTADEIETRAVARFSNRAPIIAAAMRAHEAQQYELSVPILLIQVEGMCVQEFNTKLYSTKKGVPLTKELAESMSSGEITDVFLLPLCKPSGLTAGADYRACYPDAMNRHEIIHGTFNDYASHRNSLKAISLMDYFVSVVVGEKVFTQVEISA